MVPCAHKKFLTAASQPFHTALLAVCVHLCIQNSVRKCVDRIRHKKSSKRNHNCLRFQVAGADFVTMCQHLATKRVPLHSGATPVGAVLQLQPFRIYNWSRLAGGAPINRHKPEPGRLALSASNQSWQRRHALQPISSIIPVPRVPACETCT